MKAYLDGVRSQAARAPAPAARQSSDMDAYLQGVREKSSPTPEAERPSVLRDMAGSLGSGLIRGATGLADVPGDVQSWIMNKVGLPEGVQRAVEMVNPLTFERGRTGMSHTERMTGLTPGAMKYEPQTTAGEYAQTVGEFIPGAMIGPGGVARNILLGGVAPAVASEAAGQALEGVGPPGLETAGRITGALVGGGLAGGLEGLTRRIISPTGGADPTRLAFARTLRDADVPVTAGQATGNPSVLLAEADTAAGQAMAGNAFDTNQMRQFTSAIMRSMGSNAPLATDDAMLAAQRDIVGRMQSAVAGVDVPPTPQLLTSLRDAATGYFKNTNPSVRPPVIRDIISDVAAAYRSGRPISAKDMAAWRTMLGNHLYSSDKGVANAAYEVRSALDDAIEAAMASSGQPEKMAAWKQARDHYRAFLAAEDAIKPAKERGAFGFITPQDLMSSLTRQDRRGVVTGSRGDIAELARAGIASLKPLPSQSGNQALKGIAPIAETILSPVGGLGALQIASMLGLGPVATAAMTGAATVGPLLDAARRSVRRQSMNPLVQRYLENQLVNSEAPTGMVAPALRGALASDQADVEGRLGRRSGGRVAVDHAREAQSLIVAAERAKKEHNGSTEAILHTPDEHVVKALEVANRSI